MSKKSRKGRQKLLGVCAYCGRQRAVQADHVIAKCSWLNPVNNPVIVPICKECETIKQRGESNIRECLTLDWEGSRAPGALGTPLAKTISSIAHGKSQLKDTLRDVRFERQFTKSGLDLGPYPTIELDPERMLTTLGYVIRGLHFHETETRLPSDHAPYVLRVPGSEVQELKEWMEGMPHIGPHDIGGGNCWWQAVLPDSSDPTDESSVWLLCYWDHVYFMGLTGSTAEQRRSGEKNGLATVTRARTSDVWLSSAFGPHPEQ